MQKEIEIEYYQDSHKQDLKHYTYQMQLTDNDNLQLDYFTGKQRIVQMDALEYALKSALPDDAAIKSINQVPYPSSKQDILQMLDRKDDYLATILFEQDNEVTKENSQRAANEDDQDIDNAAVTDNTDDQTNSKQEQTTPDGIQVKRIIEYQPQGKHSYQTLDLNKEEPADYDKVRKIGHSLLMYPFLYIDLKELLHDNTKTIIFQNPVGIVPDNGQLTATRKQAIASNSGLVQDALLKSNFIKIATLKNTNNNHTYDLYCESEPDETVIPEQTNSNKSNTKNKDETASKVQGTETMSNSETIKQPEVKESGSNPIATDTTSEPISKTKSEPKPVANTKDEPAKTVIDLAPIKEQIAKIAESTQQLNQVLTKINETNTAQHTSLNNDLQTIMEYQKALKTNQDEKFDKLVEVIQASLQETAKPTEKDLAGLPQAIINESKADPQAKAIYLFELINKISQTDVPEEYQALLQPEVFLKAVHLLSWPN